MIGEQLELDLPIEELKLLAPVKARRASIQERFEAFHRLNPWVYASLEMLADDWLRNHEGRVGIGMLTEVLRWSYGRRTVGGTFKLNNDFRSRYVRLLLEHHPEWAGRFETRQLRAA
jgi:hypothetical protein